MIKRKVVETVEEYDTSNNLIRKTITETNEDDDSPSPQYVTVPYLPNQTGHPWWLNYPLEVTCKSEKSETQKFYEASQNGFNSNPL